MRKHICFAFLLAALTSCKPYAYLPALDMTPQLANKNETHASIGLGTSRNTQIAYSPIENMGVMLQGYIAGKDSDQVIYKLRYGGEASIGYYKQLDTNTLVEVYGGLGLGMNRAHSFSEHIDFLAATSSRTDYAIHNHYQKAYITPSFSYISPYFDAALNCRLTLLHFDPYWYYIETRKFHDSVEVVSPVLQKLNSNTLLMLEPGFSMKVGAPFLKAVFQFSLPLVLNADEVGISHEDRFTFPFIVSAGLEMQLWRKRK